MSTIERTRPPTIQPVIHRDVLHRAADLLEEFGWCQGDYAVGSKGEPTSVDSPRTVRFCGVGAISRALVDYGLVNTEDAEREGHHCRWAAGLSSSWNDAPGRTKAEVVAKLREAAEASA